MNLKKDIKDIGYLLITPVPAKYHFEGVNNQRAARQLTVVSIALPLVATVIAVYAPVVIDKVRNLKVPFEIGPIYWNKK